MSDTVAYICVIVPALLFLSKLASDDSSTFKEWVFEFLSRLLTIVVIVAFVCGLVHFAGGLESPK